MQDGRPAPGDKRLFFTVTTGRSGTRYLAFVLSLFRGVRARHEPKPRFSTSYRAVRAVPAIAREFWTEHKLSAIHAHRAPIYAETSHLCCKGFLESLVELGFRPELLHLKRDARSVALSLWKLGSVPGRSLVGVRYYLSPWEPNFLPIADLDRLRPHDYQLCYWYCLEIEARARAYERDFAGAGVRLHAVDLEKIRDATGIQELGRRLELGPMHSLWRLRLAASAHARNERDREKRGEELAPDRLDAWEAEVRDWIASGK